MFGKRQVGKFPEMNISGKSVNRKTGNLPICQIYRKKNCRTAIATHPYCEPLNLKSMTNRDEVIFLEKPRTFVNFLQAVYAFLFSRIH